MNENEEMVEKEVQEFNGEDYFLYDSIIDEDNKYCFFAKVSDPEEIRIEKEIEDNNEMFYEDVLDEEYNYALKLFYENYNK